MRTSRDDGFSLVELMAVIVIIGVLAAIALPTLKHQRAKGFQAMMQSDLHSVVVAQKAWTVDHPNPTSDVASLEAEGYQTSDGVTPVHVKVTGSHFVACVRHNSASEWLVYDSETGTTSSSADDCA